MLVTLLLFLNICTISRKATMYTQAIKFPPVSGKPHPVNSGYPSLQIRRGKNFYPVKSEDEVMISWVEELPKHKKEMCVHRSSNRHLVEIKYASARTLVETRYSLPPGGATLKRLYILFHQMSNKDNS